VSGLDPKVTSEMYDLIYDLNRKDKITVIMISHDIMSAVKYATHILHIGDSILFGTKDEYMWSSLYKDFADSKEAKYD
jgi:zinc transport system ATP-binding protein